MGVSIRFIISNVLVLLIWATVALVPAVARFQNVIPSIPEAESLLDVGLQQFENGNYVDSGATFDRLLNEFPTNQTTTTASLLAAKSAYRREEFERARTYLNGFAGKYPSSGFLAEARLLDTMALEAIKYRTEDALDLGIILSLNTKEGAQTQGMFNGIRLAVDQHNADSRNRPVRMIFRNIDGGASATRRAMRELSALGVSAVIGTLFSEEALAAAEEAERSKTVFIAPLATDDQLVNGKTYTFQANPSMRVRGAAMARFAVLGLRLDSIAVILAADDRKISERQADGFLEEASKLGATISMVTVLPNEGSLFNLSEALPADTLDQVNAVYIPLAARNPVATVGGILSNLDRMNPRIRVIGNEGWQELPQKAHASTYLATYGDEFWYDSESENYLQFARSYKALAANEPDRLGVTGFDVTSFLLDTMDGIEEQSLAESLLSRDPFQGLGLRIHFEGSNVNQALFYFRYRDNLLALIR